MTGISKILGLPQMKLGWIVVSGPKKLAETALKRLEIISDTFLSVSTPIQQALPGWFQLKDSVQAEILQRTQKNYQVLKTEIPSSALTSEGGWYGVLEIKRPMDEEKFVLELLDRQQVLVHPGYFFDFAQEPLVVLSLLPEPSVFQKGIERILVRAKSNSES